MLVLICLLQRSDEGNVTGLSTAQRKELEEATWAVWTQLGNGVERPTQYWIAALKSQAGSIAIYNENVVRKNESENFSKIPCLVVTMSVDKCQLMSLLIRVQ